MDKMKISFTKYAKSKKNKTDRILSVLLAISILLIFISIVYVLINPVKGESFTEFYLLGENGKTGGYPVEIKNGENTSVTIGIANHEQDTIVYTIDIWLINYTITSDQILNESKYVITNAWFMDKIDNVTLEPIDINTDKAWSSQWEYNYTFNINKTGDNLKLVFLLYKTETIQYYQNIEYKDIIDDKINNSYEDLYLLIKVE